MAFHKTPFIHFIRRRLERDSDIKSNIAVERVAERRAPHGGVIPEKLMKIYRAAPLIVLSLTMPFFNAYGVTAASCTSQKVETLIKDLESISWSPPTEAGGEYSAELIEQLGECRDPKAIPAILAVLGHAGGSLVVDAFAKIGPSSVPALADKVKTGTKSEKMAALFYLGKLPEKLPSFGHNLSTNNKKEMQAVFKKAIVDEDYEVRESTILAISSSIGVYDNEEKRELTKLLESISWSDPYVVRRSDAGKETTIYPVREKAASLLKKIKQ